MFANNECSSWYNRACDILLLVWNKGKEILFDNGSMHKVSQTNLTPGSARSTVLSAMAVEQE